MLQQTLSAKAQGQTLRFLLTGSLNTLVGFAVIWGLLALEVQDLTANLVGYSVGLSLSFILNRRWTFQQTTAPDTREIVLFGFAFLAAYAANLGVIFLGPLIGMAGNPILHLFGICVYTLVFFFLTKMVVFASARQRADFLSSLQIGTYWPEYTAVASSVGILCYALTLPLTHDVSWQFWLARQMLGGVPLYTHLMEINPPLWFWMAMPLQLLGTKIGVGPDRLYIAAIIIFAAWSAIVTSRLLTVENARRGIFIIAILLLCLVAPLSDFGQREQITIIFVLPYCALLFKRAMDEQVSAGLALTIGLVAAGGFALKHYFALVPIVLELWILWRSRSLRYSLRVETITVGTLAVVYVISIAFFTPDFFRIIVPMVSSAYHGYEKPLIEQLGRTEVLIWFIVAISYLQMRRELNERDRGIGDVLGLSAVAFAASYFMQQKGWQYHAIPATVCASLLIIHCLAASRCTVKPAASYPFAWLAATLFLIMGLSRGPYDSEWAKSMDRILDKEKAGSSVMILTVDPRRVFPFVEEHGLIWPSRHFAHWMVSGIAASERGHRGAKVTKEIELLSNVVRRQALEDIKCHPPVLILSQIRNRSGVVINPERFRMTDFFRRDDALREYLATNYALEWTDRTFEAYRRTAPLDPQGANCYRISTKS
jgi:putative flippase GtrA